MANGTRGEFVAFDGYFNSRFPSGADALRRHGAPLRGGLAAGLPGSADGASAPSFDCRRPQAGRAAMDRDQSALPSTGARLHPPGSDLGPEAKLLLVASSRRFAPSSRCLPEPAVTVTGRRLPAARWTFLRDPEGTPRPCCWKPKRSFPRLRQQAARIASTVVPQLALAAKLLHVRVQPP